MRTELVLFFIAVVVHGAWALTVPAPVDWDPSYYQSVALHAASGDGMITGSVWNLLWLPASLPFPAHLHWMPLPVWVLIPGSWLWPAHGAQVTTVLLAALWAPLAHRLATRLNGSPPVAVLAGGLALTGLGYARFLSTPDCVALFGVVGGLAFLATAEKRWWLTVILAILAAMTRNDGFLLGAALALGPWRWMERAGLVLLPGGATVLWTLRNVQVAGSGYLESRAALSRAIDLEQMLAGHAQALSVVDRFVHAVGSGIADLPTVALYYAPAPALLGWWFVRERPWARPFPVFLLGMPFLTLLLAPGVAASGSLFRSTSAVLPMACALAAIGLMRIGAWSQRVRGYHPAFLPVLIGGCVAVGSVWVMPVAGWASLPPVSPCERLAGVPTGRPVLSYEPLQLEARCGVPGVFVSDRVTPEQVAELVRRYHVGHLLLYPADHPVAATLSEPEARALLPDWQVRGALLVAPDR